MELISFIRLFNAEMQRRRVRRVFWGCLRQELGVRSQESVRSSWSLELEEGVSTQESGSDSMGSDPIVK